MSLSKDNIHFIDTYLDNSDIHYADIRMEMVDHVASAIEIELDNDPTLTFYEAFKTYMVNNKANLLNNNKTFLKNTDKKILKQVAKNTITIQGVLVFTLTALGVTFLINTYGFDVIKSGLFFAPLLSISVLALVYLVLSRVYNFDRFSGVERIGFVFMALFQIINFLQIITRKQSESDLGRYTVIVLTGLIFTLIFAFIKTCLDTIINYTKEYKTLS